MTPDTYIALAKQIAEEYNLPPALVCAVCEHESSWVPWAIRFEPGFLDRYLSGMKNLTATEMDSRAYSFGLMQIMGQTARELGFVGKYLSQLCDPETGIEYGCKKLSQCLQRAGGDQSVALAHYNGGSDPTYAPNVLELVPKYQ